MKREFTYTEWFILRTVDSNTIPLILLPLAANYYNGV